MSMYWYEYFIIHIETSTYWSVPISRQTVISTCVEISVRRDNGASIQRVNPIQIPKKESFTICHNPSKSVKIPGAAFEG